MSELTMDPTSVSLNYESSSIPESQDDSLLTQKREKVPYKSFKKKYRKMEIKFAKVMARSEELYRQDILSKKIFNRLLREKSRLLDILIEIEYSPHSSSRIKELDNNFLEADFDSSTLDTTSWNDDVKHLAALYDNSFEFSDDEASTPIPRNPMSLLEWLRRNQPNVFAPESASAETASTDGTAGASASQAALGSTNGATTGNSGTVDGGVTKGKKKRRASNVDGDGVDGESKPQSKKKKKTQKKSKAVQSSEGPN